MTAPFSIHDVAGGHDGLHARERFGLCRVDRVDARVRVRATQNLAPDHTRHGGVGGKGRAARDFVDTVGTNSALANPLVVDDNVHRDCSRISAAASSTARTILS